MPASIRQQPITSIIHGEKFYLLGMRMEPKPFPERMEQATYRSSEPIPKMESCCMKTRADGNLVEYSYGANALEQELHTARSKQAKQPAQQYRYDSRGRIIGVVNGNGVETGYRLDTWGRIGEVNNPDGGKEQYSYDYAGNITSTKDANGGVITYRYNSMGKVCEIIDQEGASETFRYDREGRMILHTDRNGNQVRTQYNVDGNPVREIAINSSGEQAVTRSWEYDTAGNVKKAICGGLCYSYRYRSRWKIVAKILRWKDAYFLHLFCRWKVWKV